MSIEPADTDPRRTLPSVDRLLAHASLVAATA